MPQWKVHVLDEQGLNLYLSQIRNKKGVNPHSQIKISHSEVIILLINIHDYQL